MLIQRRLRQGCTTSFVWPYAHSVPKTACCPGMPDLSSVEEPPALHGLPVDCLQAGGKPRRRAHRPAACEPHEAACWQRCNWCWGCQCRRNTSHEDVGVAATPRMGRSQPLQRHQDVLSCKKQVVNQMSAEGSLQMSTSKQGKNKCPLLCTDWAAWKRATL